MILVLRAAEVEVIKRRDPGLWVAIQRCYVEDRVMEGVCYSGYEVSEKRFDQACDVLADEDEENHKC
ncbi:hypothetical protein SmaMPs15_000070 [Stenotrophomonas maltophilia phage vB_SmaM_Ps15]|uniref:Uncharacterized protein n=1 Tax=Stenotrophomonas maltophilia phage vB_SmaM_Ps15 TaxID=3071007 RepID=A0AAE9JV83_9CAUD|nr:hypothetical protein PQC01_gp070 [Stenotrophomonas maltophilia phage vB_SmaM_Ps15]UMO77221.1 hypothetical protein SmaMPs15_000070 [Stenotrophomonas maltophilia phage vB_SmaM_Ps15]